MLEGFDPSLIKDLEQAKQGIVLLLNLVEELKRENQQLREEVQRLRDEVNRLKGEQGRPSVKANKKAKEEPSKNHSSEKERKKPQDWAKSSKLENIQIDREEVVKVNQEDLPEDAQFKGYEEVVVQDLIIKTDNILFRKEKYYSPSQGKTYLAQVPVGYEGGFGPTVKSQAIALYFGGIMTEPKILEWLLNAKVQISAGQLSNFLIKDQNEFHQEKDAIYEAGLKSTPWQQTDDTKTRVDGQNQHCHVVCNPFYSAYFTMPHKDRLTVLDVLRNFRKRIFLLNTEAYELLAQFGISTRIVNLLKEFPQGQDLDEALFLDLLEKYFPVLGPQNKQRILESAAIAAYHRQLEFPVVSLLVCDDAPQFKWLTEELALCWVHDGRHYKKLVPYIDYHRKFLEEFQRQYWAYYHRLLIYREHPSEKEKEELSKEFDILFSTKTGYCALDERIALSEAKKDWLLIVLDHPEIPLHNNAAELAARQRVRKRDVSFGPRTEDGKKAWDTFNTILGTAKKLGVNFYQYVYDRISGTKQIPPLSETIQQKAAEMQLGVSWESS
jgi:hypothetical protein